MRYSSTVTIWAQCSRLLSKHQAPFTAEALPNNSAVILPSNSASHVLVHTETHTNLVPRYILIPSFGGRWHTFSLCEFFSSISTVDFFSKSIYRLEQELFSISTFPSSLEKWQSSRVRFAAFHYLLKLFLLLRLVINLLFQLGDLLSYPPCVLITVLHR